MLTLFFLGLVIAPSSVDAQVGKSTTSRKAKVSKRGESARLLKKTGFTGKTGTSNCSLDARRLRVWGVAIKDVDSKQDSCVAGFKTSALRQSKSTSGTVVTVTFKVTNVLGKRGTLQAMWEQDGATKSRMLCANDF